MSTRTHANGYLALCRRDAVEATLGRRSGVAEKIKREQLEYFGLPGTGRQAPGCGQRGRLCPAGGEERFPVVYEPSLGDVLDCKPSLHFVRPRLYEYGQGKLLGSELYRRAQLDRDCPNGLSELVFASMVFNFLDKNESGFSLLKLFKGFCTFLPRTLINGYIYLKRYTGSFKHKFRKIDQLLKIYLACCVISNKYEVDVQIWNSEVVANWGIDLDEMNYLEALLINTLNYDLFISDEDYQLCYLYVQSNGSNCRFNVAHNNK